MIKLIVFDIDGVITDGTYTVDSDGKESKTISYKDLDSFNLIKSLNIKTMFITSEKTKLSTYFNEKFKPDFFYEGVKNKFEILNEFLIENKINIKDICYVGDGKKDIECIEKSGLSICPLNAIYEVKAKAKIILNICGGSGVIYDVYRIINNKNSVLTSSNSHEEKLNEILADHVKIVEQIKKDDSVIDNIDLSIKIMIDSIRKGGVIFCCGNGGSAADAQHFVGELVSKFNFDRNSIPAIALTTNSSILTSIGNDYSYDKIFSRQIEGLGKQGDVLLAITTSGNSSNIRLAIKEAYKKGMKVIILTSKKYIEDGGENVIIKIPSSETARIQEFHIMVIHCICGAIEKEFVCNEE